MTAIKATILVLLCIGLAHAAPEAGDATCIATLPTAIEALTHTAGLLPIGNLTTPVLDESIPVTLFAPSDEAWLDRAPQLGLNPGDIVASARASKITFILQHHVVEGAAVDYTQEYARGFPLSTSLSSSPCVPTSPVTVNVTDTPLGLLVQSLGTSALVKDQITTCGGISRIYVIDDVLNPCCTNMFDIVKSPTLAPVFSSERDTLIKPFVNYFNGPLFNKETQAWTLPPTLFIPTAEALVEYLTSVKQTTDIDIATLNQVYRNITWMHMSSVAVTKESLLLGAPTRKIPTLLKLKEPTCPTGLTVTLRDPTDEKAKQAGYFGTVTAGEGPTAAIANIVKSYKMCKGTTVYVVDKVLSPCDLTKFAPCAGFSAFQKRPSVRPAFVSNDTNIRAFMDYYTGALWSGVDNAKGDWTLPSTLLMPSAAAIQEFVGAISASPELGDDESLLGDVYNVTALSHMTQAATDNATLAKGPVTGTPLAFGAFKEACLRQFTMTPSGNGIQVAVGTDTANVLESRTLCGNTTVHVIDKVLVPCKLESILPCQSFDALQKKPLVAQAFNTTNPNVTQFVNYITGALWDGESANPGWKLPPTLFIPTAAAINEYVNGLVSDPTLSEQIQTIFNATAGLHLTKAIIDNTTLTRSPTVRAKPFSASVFNDTCLQAITVSNTPTGITVSNSETTAKVVGTYTLCKNVTVYIIDQVLAPCNLTTLTTPEDAGKPKCKQFYSIQRAPELQSLFNSSDKNLQTFMNYFNGPLYDKKINDWVLPPTLFIPAADTMTPFLQKSIGKNVNSEKAKKLYAIMFYLHQANVSIPLDTALNTTTPIVVNSALKSNKACQFQYTITPEAVGGATNKVSVTVTAGGSKATVVNHWELCKGVQVYLIDQPLVPCDIAQLLKDYKVPAEFGKSRGAAGTRSVSAAMTMAAGLAAAAVML